MHIVFIINIYLVHGGERGWEGGRKEMERVNKCLRFFCWASMIEGAFLEVQHRFGPLE